MKLPKELKLTRHAKQRLSERNNDHKHSYNYNMDDLMKTVCKWYTTDDLIKNSNLYAHSLYVCRKAKDKFGYITDGNIEVLYDKNANVALTILSIKEKFLPIDRYIKNEN